jgi:hypothetical protein
MFNGFGSYTLLLPATRSLGSLESSNCRTSLVVAFDSVVRLGSPSVVRLFHAPPPPPVVPRPWSLALPVVSGAPRGRGYANAPRAQAFAKTL